MTEQPNETIVDTTHDPEDEHLAREHGLVKTTAYVVSAAARKKEKKEDTARRMAEMRARKKAAGLVMYELPIAMVESIKAAGGPGAWLESFQVKPEPRIIEIEKIVEVVRIDTARLDKARSEIAELKADLDRERKMLEGIYEMSLMDRIFRRWP